MTSTDSLPYPGRAHLHLLDLAPSQTGRPPTGLPWYEEVNLQPPAMQALRWHLATPGRWRGGWLFGRPASETMLQVEVAGASAYPDWDVDVLEGDRRYLLGQADLLRALRPDLDWVASWVIRPDNSLPSAGEAEELVQEAHRMGIVHDGYALLIVGLSHDHPTGLLCRWLEDAVDLLQFRM